MNLNCRSQRTRCACKTLQKQGESPNLFLLVKSESVVKQAGNLYTAKVFSALGNSMNTEVEQHKHLGDWYGT